jgi:hypothetical protein
MRRMVEGMWKRGFDAPLSWQDRRLAEGCMALDAALRAELMEAREKIIAQLDEIEFRATAKGFARRGGPPAYGQVYAELKNALSEINELLEPSDEDDAIYPR